MTRGVLEAAEELQAPVILCHAEVHFKYTPLEKIAPILVNEARMAKVPVALLLDHGKSFSAIVKAMHLGFNAVMYDGSDLPFEQNAENTKEVVRIARALDVSVEAELGHVVRPKSAGADGCVFPVRASYHISVRIHNGGFASGAAYVNAH
jgi:fructose-bisphosphate aldolase class II